jgi:hypothetical protein
VLFGAFVVALLRGYIGLGFAPVLSLALPPARVVPLTCWRGQCCWLVLGLAVGRFAAPSRIIISASRWPSYRR